VNPSAVTTALPGLRANSLAIALQDVITVILRVRYRVQRVSDVAAFRDSIRKMIGAGTQEARRLGYSDATSQMALYAIVGFLDESVLNSQDPAFQDWARRPLGEEMFGGHFAGEYFFRHLNELLAAPDTMEGADALELHGLCLLLGYRGKLAFGDTGEVQVLIRRIQEKIARVRGPMVLCRVQEQKAGIVAPPADRWIKRLAIITALLFVLTLIAFGAYYFLLSGQLSSTQAMLQPAALMAPASIAAVSLRGYAL
jgi:type VI secretion system protein ImpK